MQQVPLPAILSGFNPLSQDTMDSAVARIVNFSDRCMLIDPVWYDKQTAHYRWPCQERPETESSGEAHVTVITPARLILSHGAVISAVMMMNNH